ncbi:hypothetical protein [Pseudoxanthomonas mexicana]
MSEVVEFDSALGVHQEDYQGRDIAQGMFEVWASNLRSDGRSDLVDDLRQDVAVCVDWRKVKVFPFMMLSYEHWWTASSELAELDRDSPLTRCNTWSEAGSRQCSCHVIRHDGSVWERLPDDVIDDFRDVHPQAQRDGTGYLSAKKHVLIESHVHPSGVDANELVKSFQLPSLIQYPYSRVDYSQACWNTREYTLAPVLKTSKISIDSIIEDRVKAGLYNCQDVELDQPPGVSTGDIQERHCSVTKHVSRDRLHGSQLRFPTSIDAEIRKMGVLELWVEAVVQVDDDYRVMRALDGVTPLVMRTKDDTYVGIEIQWPQPAWACAVSTRYEGIKVVEASSCSTEKCLSEKQAVVLDEIKAAISAPLLSAQQSPLIGPPGQYRFERSRQKSLVVGGPFYENSSYQIDVWSSGSDVPALIYLRSNHRGIGNGASLFVNIEHTMTITPSRMGAYAEPTDDQWTAYRKAILDSLSSATLRSCKKLSGTMRDRTCHL